MTGVFPSEYKSEKLFARPALVSTTHFALVTEPTIWCKFTIDTSVIQFADWSIYIVILGLRYLVNTRGLSRRWFAQRLNTARNI